MNAYVNSTHDHALIRGSNEQQLWATYSLISKLKLLLSLHLQARHEPCQRLGAKPQCSSLTATNTAPLFSKLSTTIESGGCKFQSPIKHHWRPRGMLKEFQGILNESVLAEDGERYLQGYCRLLPPHDILKRTPFCGLRLYDDTHGPKEPHHLDK